MRGIHTLATLMLTALMACTLSHETATAQSIYVSRNVGYANQTVTGPTVLNKKVGSYIIQNASTDTVKVISLETALASDSFKVVFSNLNFVRYPSGSIGATTGNTPIANTTRTDFSIMPGAMVQIDVWADLNSATTTPTGFTTTLKMNSTYGIANTPFSSTVNGQTIHLQ